MDWKQFFASIVGSLAWPSAGIIFLVLFRKPLGRLIGQIRNFAAAGVKVDFSETVEDVKEQAERVEAEKKELPTDVVVLDPAVLQLAQKHPEAAVLQEYKELESVILQIRARLPDNKPLRNINEVLNYLNTAGMISGSVIGLFQTIRRARNAVVHSNDPAMTAGEAIELIRETRMLTGMLRVVGESFPSQADLNKEKPRP